MANTEVTFKLLLKRKGLSWKVPVNNQLVKKDGILKRIRYIEGADSIFEEDQLGDEISPPLYFEKGIKRVRKDNTILITYLKKHPRYGKDWIIEDKDAEALDKLTEQENIKRALAKVDIVSEHELRAHAIVMFGKQSMGWSKERIKSQLNDLAFNDAKNLLEQMNSTYYNTKETAALAILLNVIKINETNTAVQWVDTGKTIVTVAVGVDPLSKLTQFLTGDSEEVKNTLQEIGERVIEKRRFQDPKDVEKVVSKVIDKKDLTSPIEDADEDEDFDDEDDIETVRFLYTENYKKDVPPNKKNDIEWLKAKNLEYKKANS